MDAFSVLDKPLFMDQRMRSIGYDCLEDQQQESCIPHRSVGCASDPDGRPRATAVPAPRPRIDARVQSRIEEKKHLGKWHR